MRGEASSSYFSQTNSILFSKAKCLKKVNVSFTGYFIKQHDIVEYFACQPDSKLSGEGLASKILRKINTQTKTSLSKKQILNFYDEKNIIQRANSTTFRLRMFFMISSFKGKFKNQTSKSLKQNIRFWLNLPLKISYQSITF